MKKFLLTALCMVMVLCASQVHSFEMGTAPVLDIYNDYCILFETVDGSVANKICGKIILPNGSFTNNGDGTWALTFVGGGEANTASNVGSVGTGVWKQKTGVDLEFYKLNSVNNILSIALDGVDKIDLTINQGNISHDSIADVSTSDHHVKTVDTFVTNKDTHDHVGGDGNPIDHNSTLNYVANEHIDWTGTSENFLTSGSLTIDSNVNKLYMGDLQEASISYDGSDMYFNSQEVGGGDFVFENGNVGIGVAIPGYKLDVNGDINATTVTADLTGAVTGNADTATVLVANGANCSAGNYPLGVDASGAVENCTADSDTTYTAGTNLSLIAGAFNVLNAFLVNDADDTMVGVLTADGFVLGTNEPLTLGSGTFIHDGANFVLDDTLSLPSGGTVQDFLDIPSGANPTIDVEGKIGIDTTGDQFLYNGSGLRVVWYKDWFSIALESPVSGDTFFVFKAPANLTFTNVDCIVINGTSSVIDIQECSSTGTGCITIDATITCDTDGASDDGSISNGTIDAGDWVLVDYGTVTGGVDSVTITGQIQWDRN